MADPAVTQKVAASSSESPAVSLRPASAPNCERADERVISPAVS